MTGWAAMTSSLPQPTSIWGRVIESDGATVTLGGLGQLARIGDHIEISCGSGTTIAAEVIALGEARVKALLMAPATGLSAGLRAYLVPISDPRPGRRWLGTVVDAFGQTADGTDSKVFGDPAPLRRAPPRGDLRRGLGDPVTTGFAILDTALPLCRGQRIGVFAGSGVGKSSLIDGLTRHVSADVVVVGLIGERGREVGDFTRGLARSGALERTVIIAATSDQVALTKRRAGLLTLATAEYFRDQGLHVLCLFDSITRYAEAHREIALAAGEPAALRAFPPSTAGELAALCERAGPGKDTDPTGDITAVFTVLVAGSDMDEPVADMIRGVLDGHVVLDRGIAERGRLPAIDLSRSVSRAAPGCLSAGEAALAIKARKFVSLYEEAAPMIRAGLYVEGADPDLDRAIRLYPRLDAFVGAVTPEKTREQNFTHLHAILDEE